MKTPLGFGQVLCVTLGYHGGKAGWNLSHADCEALSTLLNVLSLSFLVYKALIVNGLHGLL